MVSEEKKSELYKSIFKIFLNFSPNYRRNIIELPNMFEWLKELGLKNKMFDKEDFYILMEWFNSINLIKPFCVVYFPPEHDYHICINNREELLNEIKNSNLIKLFDDGIVTFPTEVYDIEPEKNLKAKPWNHNKIKHKIMTKARSAKEEDPKEQKISTEETRYYYHPIQFFQLLTYLKGGRIYLDLKNYKKFYWARRLSFDDTYANEIKKDLKEEGKSIQEFIDENSSRGIPFHRLTWIYYIQNRWLIERSLNLWIKIESYLSPRFYYKRSVPDIDMHYQISEFEIYNEDKFKKYRDQYYQWREDVEVNFKNYFKSEEFNHLKEFREYMWRYKDVDGLENFIDLFLHINHNLKAKLKGFPNYFINIVKIYQILKIMEDEFFKHYPELSDYKTERKWYEPKYVFKDKQDLNEHKKKIFLDYGLTQEETYVIFVEGPTESILLDDWVNLVFYRTNIRVSVKELGGKRKKFIFEYLSKEFNINEFFLVLDQDTKDYANGLKANLKGKGINEDYFHIFYPDFVTANFSISEIYEAFLSFFIELKEVIKSKTDEELDLSKNNKDEFLKMLKEKKDIDKFEDLIELFFKQFLNNSEFELKKTKFAKHLLNVMRKNLSKTEGREMYPFEKILGKFIDRIKAKRFPER